MFQASDAPITITVSILIVLGWCSNSASQGGSDVATVHVGDIHSTEYAIPSARDIKHIVVEIYDSPELLPDVPQFELPEAFYSDVIKAMGRGIPDPSPVLRYHEIGTMRITSKDGTSRRVCWYWQGKGSLKYSVQGVRFYRPLGDERPTDEAVQLDSLLRKAFLSKTGLNASDPMKETFKRK